MAQLNALYAVYRLYVNHFLPVSKLQAKHREGSRVKRIFDQPMTPYQRLLNSPDIRAHHKAALRTAHAKLDVYRLKQRVDDLIARIPASTIR